VAVAYPQGTPTVEGEGFGWDTGSGIFSTTGVDDVAALGEMLDVVLATGCVDPSRVIVGGESNGAAMALVAACDPRFAGRAREVLMVIPAVDPAVLARCPAGKVRPIPITAVAGRKDRTAPYLGGRGTLLAQEVWFAQAAARVNGCTGVGTPAKLDAFVARFVATGCEECAQLFAVADGTHTWPGTREGTAGLRPGTFGLDALLLDRALSGSAGCLT
jgi:poly(3-hydroxybutyrate) depolymerase